MQNPKSSNVLDVLNEVSKNISDGVQNITKNIQEITQNVNTSSKPSDNKEPEKEKLVSLIEDDKKKESEDDKKIENDKKIEQVNDKKIENVPKKPRKKLRIVKNYYKGILSKQVQIHIKYVNANLMQHLNEIVNNNYSGKCIVEGYIKNKSCDILTYSSGQIDGEKIIMNVVFNCLICNPVEGMLIDCIVKNITKAGIRAEINEAKTPLVLFVSRDHNINSDHFNSVNINDKIKVRVIGTRFELNDEYISVIGELKR
tara:strand:+ start:1684 stop:2454 length:771 start_codon:yes stop_codon:yes gene_type:complete